MINKKILITGGAGFIGSHLVERLHTKNKIYIIDNLSNGNINNIKNFKKNVNFFKKDINEIQKINLPKKIDYIFHLAALADVVPSIENPKEYFQSNVNGTLEVLEFARKRNIKKIIYAASASCYGIVKKHPTNEDDKIDPQYPYALTKKMGEDLILHYHKVYKMGVTSLRLFNVFGTRSRTSGTYGAVFGVFLAQKLANKKFTVVGDGMQSRDFTYVTDVCDAFIKAAKIRNSSGKIYNVGTGVPRTVNELTKLIGGEKIHIPDRPGEPRKTAANIKRIKKDLNWKPKITFSEGVSIILKNINYWKKAPLWTPKKISKATKTWFKHLK